MFKGVSSEKIYKMLSDISIRLLSSEGSAEFINGVVQEVAETLSFDRLFICENVTDKESGKIYLVTQIEWSRSPYIPIRSVEEARILPYDRFPRWYEVLSKGNIFSGMVADFPENERMALAPFEPKLVICVPIIFREKFWGMVALHLCKDEYEPTDADKDVFTAISMMFASYIIRKNITDDLRYNEERLYKALEGSGEGVWDLDCVSNTFYLSESAKKLTGSKDVNNTDRVPLEFMVNLIIEEDRYMALQFLDELSKSDNPVVAKPFRLSINDTIHWFSLTGSVINRDALGAPLRMIGTVLDVTDKLELENKLKEALLTAEAANAAKSQFLATMSHEIRTPLNGMIGFLRLLVEHVETSTGQEYLRIINNSTGTLLNIINSILDISKVESGNMELDIRECNISEELEAIARLFSASAFEKRAFLHTFIDIELPITIQCDQQRIRQVISNLLNNALKFTAQGGFIYLEAVVENKTDERVDVKFSIQDTGIGIAESYLENIFKPFTQADSSVSRKYGGSGLGLAIAYKFVELMGGELKITSKVGEGSNFYFVLSFPVIEDKKVLEATEDKRSIAYIEYPKSAFGFDRNLKAIGYNAIEFENIDTLLQDDISKYYVIVVSTFYTNQSILNDIQRVKDKFPQVKILLITYPVDVSIFDVLNSLKIRTRIRPFSLRNLYAIIASMQLDDDIIEEEKGLGTSVTFSGKILVAEDNMVNCKLINIILNKYGFDTTVVTNGMEALKKMEEDVFDIVLMDVNMPVMDGMTATREIRRIEALEGKKRIPVIALTANVMKEDAKEFLAAGMDHILTKPIIQSELEKVFKEYLPND